MKKLVTILVMSMSSFLVMAQSNNSVAIEKTRSELQSVKAFSDLFTLPAKQRIISSSVVGKIRSTTTAAENKGSLISLAQSEIIKGTKPGDLFHISVETAEGPSNSNKQTLDYIITVLPEKTK